jgi:glycosyltransferase involved in cell wall biosynthesis
VTRGPREPRQPRILRVITRLNVGGPATHVTVADRGLRARGWETLLAFGTVEPDEEEIDIVRLDLPLVRVPTLARPVRPVADLRSAVAIAALIRRHRPDVIHSHLSKAGLIARSVAMVTSRAVRIHTFHGTVFGGYFGVRTSGAILRAERFLGRRSDAVVALSPLQKQELLDNGIAPEARIRIVPLGLPLDRFTPAGADGQRELARQRLDIPRDAFAIVAVGRLVAIKRLDRLIEAVALASRQIPRAHLYLVGGGAEREILERLVGSAGLTERVTFVGWAADTPDWYAAADVVALTSDREGTPLALIEAAAAARPVVATDVGGVADVVADGLTGFVVAADDMASFADRLIRLNADPDLREAMSRAAPGRAAGYGEERLVDDLDRLYRETLREAGETR